MTNSTATFEVRSAPAAARVRNSRLARNALRTAGALAAVALVAFLIARYRSRAIEPTVRYETALIDEGPLDAKVTATGAVSPLISVLVGSQVSGRISQLFVDYGSPVKRGQIVALIEPSLFRALAAQARANLAAARASVDKASAQQAQAEKQFIRSSALLAQGLVTHADYDLAEANARVGKTEIATAQSAVAQAKAALDQAELNLKYTSITSPIDGVVISRSVDVGQTVAAALQAPTLFTIAQDLTQMQVDANVAEADVGKVRPGMDVEFSVDAYPGRIFVGKVRQVRDNAQTLQNVVTYDAVIDVANPERLLKPGMTANVVLSYAKRAHAVRVPVAGLRFKPDQEVLNGMLGAAQGHVPAVQGEQRSLWLLRGTSAVPVAVRVGLNDGSYAEVVSGNVKPGERVVVEVMKRAP